MGPKILIALALVTLAAGLMWLLWGSITGTVDELTVPVRQGDMVIRVVATGKLESGNAVRVEATPRGKVLTYLAPEGKMVKKGEVLARFDDTDLREGVLTRANDLKMAKARLAEKEEQMRVRTQELAAQITMLEADLAIKRTQYERLKSLPHPDDVTRARLERDYRNSRLEIARQDLEIIRDLTQKGTMVFSREEMQEKELAFAEAQGELEKAENLLSQVLEGALPGELDAVRRDQVKAQIDLDDAKARQPRQLTILEADVRSAQAEVDKMKARLDRSQKELDELEAKATGEGMLVYRTFRGRPLELGAQLWHRVHLFDIADLDNMVVRAKVGESEFSRIRVGQPVEIRAFSVPDRPFPGIVQEVSKVAEDKAEGQMFRRRSETEQAGIQAFDVLVGIDRRHAFLRPNVEAEVVILCDEVPDAMTVPIDAVFEHDGRKWVRVLTGRRARLREVTLGVYGSNWVEVKEGLKTGEEVLLRVPGKEGG
ncbi:MAG TPA: efflux RND transporter periplasmic adaptor subunit [Planctomycetota bacterium]|nr:efflux RND transporter periplasmic adaptor subunit [Planctomycetota bacterium]